MAHLFRQSVIGIGRGTKKHMGILVKRVLSLLWGI